jgi:hypothetical protein
MIKNCFFGGKKDSLLKYAIYYNVVIEYYIVVIVKH